MSAARQAAGEAALLTPHAYPIGPYFARPFSGGDMLLAGRLGLVLASGEKERIGAMTREEQTQDLLTIGALLCHPPEALTLALWHSVDRLRAELIAPVLFTLSPAQTAELITFVGRYFGQATAVDFEVEPKPDDPAAETAAPRGNASGLRG